MDTHPSTSVSSTSSSSISPTTSTAKKWRVKLTGRDCRVCAAPSDGTHFGVDACRACAAFFRRSILLEKRYVCRAGAHRCDVTKGVRCMCRKCRYTKCLAVGMLPEHVHARGPTSDGSKSGTRNLLQTADSSRSASPANGASTAPIATNTDDDDEDESSEAIEFQFAVNKDATTTAPQLTNLLPPPRSTVLVAPGGLLARTLQLYKSNLVERRDASWRSFSAHTSGRNVQSPDQIHLADMHTLNETMRADVPLCAEFVVRAFPQFNDYSQLNKWRYFKHFLLHLWQFECGYRAYLDPGNQQHNDFRSMRFHVSEACWISDSHAPFFFSNLADADKRSEFGNAVQMLRLHLQHIFVDLVLPLRRLQLTECELSAVLVLLLFDGAERGEDVQAEEEAAPIRATVFEELHRYYRDEMHLDETGSVKRLGAFMLFLCDVHRVTHRTKEQVELVRVLNVMEDDEFLVHFVRS